MLRKWNIYFMVAVVCGALSVARGKQVSLADWKRPVKKSK